MPSKDFQKKQMEPMPRLVFLHGFAKHALANGFCMILKHRHSYFSKLPRFFAVMVHARRLVVFYCFTLDFPVPRFLLCHSHFPKYSGHQCMIAAQDLPPKPWDRLKAAGNCKVWQSCLPFGNSTLLQFCKLLLLRTTDTWPQPDLPYSHDCNYFDVGGGI